MNSKPRPFQAPKGSGTRKSQDNQAWVIPCRRILQVPATRQLEMYEGIGHPPELNFHSRVFIVNYEM
jgi:hypothetical protein